MRFGHILLGRVKLQVVQADLAKALSLASRFVNPRAQLPLLGSILFSAKKNKLVLSATNLEISLSLSIGAKTEVVGEIGIPAKAATDLFSSLGPGNTSLEAIEEQLKISSEGFVGTLSGMNATDFPTVPHALGKGAYALPKDKFVAGLAQAVFAASNDETRPVLTGVLFVFEKGDLYIIATDGFRLSQKKLVLGTKMKDQKLILPKAALSELLRVAGASEQPLLMEAKKVENQVVFGLGSTVLTTRVIEGEFPDYQKIIPKEQAVKVRLDKEDFMRGVKTSSVFARDSANVVKLSILKGNVTMSAQSATSGEQEMELEAKVEGEASPKGLTISYNYRFIEEFLNSVQGTEIEIGLSDANSPGVFRDTGDPDYLHLIMPVKV